MKFKPIFFVGWAEFPPDPFPPAEATLSDLPAGRPVGRLDDFKFFFGGKLLCKKR